MPTLMRQSRELCNQSEFDLYFASRPREITSLTPARLKSKIARARQLRDKFRGLGKSQARRSKAAKAGERTKQKAQLFDEVLQRFQARLKKLEAAEQRKRAAEARRNLAAKRKKKPTKKALPRPAKAVKKTPSPRARGARKKSRFVRGGVTRKRTHAIAAGKRSQAKRDARRGR
jgi:hypothetical protein